MSGGGVFIEPAPHRVFQRFRLLGDFLEHVMGELSSIRMVGLDVQHFHAVLNRALFTMNDAQRMGGDHGHFVVGQIDDLIGIAYQRRSIACQEVFSVTHADDERASPAGGENLAEPLDGPRCSPISPPLRRACGSSACFLPGLQ